MADTKYIINCPACDKEMKKLFIEDAGINVDICINGCGGIFFDNRELEKFDEQHENADEIFEAIKGKTFEARHDDEIRICPICDVPMAKLGGKDSVKIDVCNICGAKFIDHGELERIREEKAQNKNLDNDLLDKLENAAISETLGKAGEFAQKYNKGREAIKDFLKRLI